MPGRVLLMAMVLATSGLAALFAPPPANLDPTRLDVPYQRYTVTDSLGREITFYLSLPSEGGEKLPLVLWIQGSGCQSLFTLRGERTGDGLQGLILRTGKGRVRVLAVEKPGVSFRNMPPRPGSAEGATPEFLREHTLPRWGIANAAAVQAAWSLPGVDISRTLVMGHSEGGIVAARVAALLPKVTHVASLAGGGPTQLFSLAELDARPRPGDRPGDADQRRRAVYEEWKRIQADPENTDKFWKGHPYRRWSTFLASSLTSELLHSKAKVYLVHGVEDSATPITSFDVTVAELAAQGREFQSERLEGADHGFRTQAMEKGSPDGFRGVMERVLDWFLSGPASRKE